MVIGFFCLLRFMAKEVRGSHLIVCVLLLSNTLLMLVPGITIMYALFTESSTQDVPLRPFVIVAILSSCHLVGALYP